MKTMYVRQTENYIYIDTGLENYTTHEDDVMTSMI